VKTQFRFALAVAALGAATPAAAQTDPQDVGLLAAAVESLVGDVYEPSRWRPLYLDEFFTEGWTRAWASPPAGEGGAPRQGWIGAADGVFYRLGIVTGDLVDDGINGGSQYNGNFTLYQPLNARFELRWDVPFLVSNRDEPDGDYDTGFGDLQVTPRFLLAETTNVTHSFNVALRVPTGQKEHGNGVAAVTPSYEFWSNPWRGMVLRGGVGFQLPYTERDEGLLRRGATGNLALGYYFTPHEAAPFGDFVTYVAANAFQPADELGDKDTTVTLTPGFRTHLGVNWYLLGAVEIPVTQPGGFDFKTTGGLMKVF